LTNVHYQGVNAAGELNEDGIDSPMPFYTEGTEGTAASCDHTGEKDGYSCLACVKYYDDWCTGSESGGGQWDATCTAQCSNKCADYCGATKDLKSAKELYADWDTKGGAEGRISDVTPRNMHNIADPEWLGYSYEPDEYDIKILQGALSNSCSLGHSFWHTEGMSEGRRARHLEAMRKHRKLEDEEGGKLDLILNYIKDTVESEVAGSIYLDAAAKELGALEEVEKRVCQMLYKRAGAGTGGQVDVNAVSEREGDDVPLFWRNWGMAEDFRAGVTKGACEKYL